MAATCLCRIMEGYIHDAGLATPSLLAYNHRCKTIPERGNNHE